MAGLGGQGRKRRRGFRLISLNKMIPNLLTMGALAAGLTSVRFALQDRWEFAAVAIAVAALFDALDGRVARLLKSTSRFGAELDSLSDMVCFGVAPALILYLWTMDEAGRWGWVVCMLFAMCCGLRLARFNVMIDNPNKPSWASQFFQGVPAPAGAGLVLLPMLLSFNIDAAWVSSPILVAIWIVAIGTLLISSIPTFSFKTSRIPRALFPPVMIAFAATASFLVSAPWWTLSAFMILYLGLIPFSVRRYRKLRLNDIRSDDDDDDEAEADSGTAAAPNR